MYLKKKVHVCWMKSPLAPLKPPPRFLGLAILAILMHFAATSTATSLFVSAFSAQNRGPRCLSRVGRFSTLTIPTVLASRAQPLESTLLELLDLEKLQLAYIGTAGTAPRKDSDRPLKDQRKKRRYEARYQCKMLGEIFSASSAQHIFLEDFWCSLFTDVCWLFQDQVAALCCCHRTFPKMAEVRSGSSPWVASEDL